MFKNLSERLERSFKILKGEGRITEINIAETGKDVRQHCSTPTSTIRSPSHLPTPSSRRLWVRT